MGSYRKLKDIAAVKCAVEICNDFDIKKEILCAPGSEYSLYKNLDTVCKRREYWTEILEKKTIEKLKQLSLPECINENITGLVVLVGMKMLCWAEYHEGMFGLLRERSVDFLNSSFFTSLGLIDNKKAAEQLMNEESLNIEQKYRLACIYCFTDKLPILFKQIPRERKEAYYNGHDPSQVTQPALIKLWSYYLMGKIDLLKGEKTFNQYKIENAVKSGSLAAVEYCFQIPNIRRKEKSILTYVALKSVEIMLEEKSEMYVFELEKNDFQSSVWTPEYYYMDLICFSLSKMQESEKINFFKKDIEISRFNYIYCRKFRHSELLEYFLDWPYILYFVEMEKLVREFLPRRNFALLLLHICSKIVSDKELLNYGSQKCFDYRNLLREFCLENFDCCNKYTLQDNKTLKNAFKLKLEEINKILRTLFNLKIFTYRDLDNALLILNSPTYDERKNIISSDEGKGMCFDLMREERWVVLDKFVMKCFFCKDEANEFKKDLISTKEAKSIVIDFLENNKLDAIKCFIDWISLAGEELVEYKEEIIFSREGRRAFMVLFFINGDDESAVKVCKLLVSAEKDKAFKKTLLSEFNFSYCSNDFNRYCQRTENFLQWAISSTDENEKLKNDLIYKNLDFFRMALANCTYRLELDSKTGRRGHTIYFKGSDWISVEKLLTWCFSSEKDILDYKKVLLERFGVQIHFQLIRANQWAEAETFFAWLGLNIKDIQKLKKNTISEKLGNILSDLKYTEDYSTYDFVYYYFSTFGGLQDRLELLLRWCLCDRESVLEFKSLLEKKFGDVIHFKNILNNFSLAIEEYLIDLETDHLKSKRKLEVLSPPKKHTKKF